MDTIQTLKILDNLPLNYLNTIVQNAKKSVGRFGIDYEGSPFWSDKEVDDLLNLQFKISPFEIKWFYSYQYETIHGFDISEDGYVCFLALASIDMVDRKKTFTVLYGAVKFDSISENEVVVSDSPQSVILGTKTVSDSVTKARSVYKKLLPIIEENIRLGTLTEGNDDLMEELETLNDLDELGTLTDKGFMRRVEILLKLGGKKKKKVFGEYDIVQQYVKEPVLMNKAVSIPLTKEEAIDLVIDLSKRYQDKLMKVRGVPYVIKQTDGILPIRFKKDIGAHADPNLIEIALSEKGDWRMGFGGVYSAETIFHEFAHVLDFSRPTFSNVTAHGKDFVHLLEIILNDYRDWIEERFDFEYHVDQIMHNSQRINDYLSKENSAEGFGSKIVEMVEEVEKEKKVKENIKERLGITDTDFPLRAIMKDGEDVKIDFALFAIKDSLSKAKSKPLIEARKKLRKEGIDSIFTKEEIEALSSAVSNTNRMDFIRTLDVREQMSAPKLIQPFQEDILRLSKGDVEWSEMGDLRKYIRG